MSTFYEWARENLKAGDEVRLGPFLTGRIRFFEVDYRWEVVGTTDPCRDNLGFLHGPGTLKMKVPHVRVRVRYFVGRHRYEAWYQLDELKALQSPQEGDSDGA